MQTFLPYPDIAKSLSCLDYKRLGNQRIETYGNIYINYRISGEDLRNEMEISDKNAESKEFKAKVIGKFLKKGFISDKPIIISLKFYDLTPVYLDARVTLAQWYDMEVDKEYLITMYYNKINDTWSIYKTN